jgi:AraC-like DNA-binding protein
MRPDDPIRSTTSQRGILDPRAGEAHFQLTRHLPAEDLSFFVERYWVVRWDLRGRAPHPQETLPHPSVNLVIGTARPGVHGILTQRFHVLLEGRGQVVGTKFRPGAFYPFVRVPQSDFTDRTLPLSGVFGREGEALESAVLAAEGDDRRQIDHIETFLRARLPERDPNVALLGDVVRLALEQRSITRVEALAAQAGLPPRTLQRLFRRYIGVSPKWVIRRFRIHEAAERASAGTAVDWAATASDLGYFDQAHFIKDFKVQVGRSPAEYAALCAGK